MASIDTLNEIPKEDVDMYRHYKCCLPRALMIFCEFFEGKNGPYSVTEPDKYRLSDLINALTKYHKHALCTDTKYAEAVPDHRPIGLASLFFDILADIYSDKNIAPKDINYRFGAVFGEVITHIQQTINMNLASFTSEDLDAPFNLYGFLKQRGL